MLATSRSADQQVLAPAGLLGPPAVTDSSTVDNGAVAAAPPAVADVTAPGALRPDGSLPGGAVDPAAREATADLADQIATTVKAAGDGQLELGPLTTLMLDRLSPDPAALAATLQLVWDQSIELATQLSDDLMRGQKWSKPGALALGLGPLGLLAPVVVGVGTPLLDKFAASLPPVEEYPAELQAVLHGLEAFADGLNEGLVHSGLYEAQFYADIYTKFSTSMQEHMIVANTVIQAGMVVGIVGKAVGDLVGLAALVLLFSSGPLLVAALTYAIYSAWEAGAQQLAHDLGRGLASAAAQPFVDLHSAEGGIPFLFVLGQILGPLLMDVLLFMIGQEPLNLTLRGAGVAGRIAEVFETLKRLLPDTPEVRALLKDITKDAKDLVSYFGSLLKKIGGNAADQFALILQRKNSSILLADLRAFVEEAVAKKLDAAPYLEKILDFAESLTEQQWAGTMLLRQHPPYSNLSTAGPQYANWSWPDFFSEDGLEDALKTLLDLLGAIDGRVITNDGGLTQVISEFFYGGGKTTGAAGALMAARTILDNNPGTVLRFEVGEIRRVLDIVAYQVEAVIEDGLVIRRLVMKLEVEVKTFPNLPALDPDLRAKIVVQMRKDLLRHVLDEADPALERLQWLLDPDGYEAFAPEFEAMFREALQTEAGTLANFGADVAAVTKALDEQLSAGVLLNFYQTP